MTEKYSAGIARRHFLGTGGLGLGAVALQQLLGNQAIASPGIVEPRHFAPRAKRVIFLYMSGGPSQLETFDPKPELTRLDGQPLPETVTQGQPIAQLQGQKLVCLGPQIPFQKYGDSGQVISDFLPQIGSIADDICIVRSMQTDQINHDPAHTVMNTGTAISGRPSMGSWVTYGLGSEASDLPGFVVLTSVGGRNPQPISTRQWHNGFLPSTYQGVEFQSTGAPIHYLDTPAGIESQRQRALIETISKLDRERISSVQNQEIESRISQYELAFRMQRSIPELIDFSDEPQHALEMYGATTMDGSFAANCLLARRMVERGVRFIQLYHRGWDHHNDLVHFMKICAGHCDRASAALVRDLKQRGLLEDTLIIWGGEFGRTPMAQTNKGGAGRDHHIRAFSMWLAGGGIKPGITFGGTDEFGYHATENPVHVHDLHATILYLLGIDHKRLTIRTQGRDFRLTDVAGKIVRPIIE